MDSRGQREHWVLGGLRADGCISGLIRKAAGAKAWAVLSRLWVGEVTHLCDEYSAAGRVIVLYVICVLSMLFQQVQLVRSLLT